MHDNERVETVSWLLSLLMSLDAASRTSVLDAMTHELGLQSPDVLTAWLTDDRIANLQLDPARLDLVARRALARLGSACESDDAAQAGTRELSAHSSPVMPVHNLPGRPHPPVVGREREIAEVLRLLARDSSQQVVSLAGRRGVGKTRMAAEVGWRIVERSEQLAPGDRFVAIIWVALASSRPHAFTDQELESSDQSLALVERTIADVLNGGRPASATAQAPADFEVAYTPAHLLQQAGRVLLIVDGLDETRDARVAEFLRDLPQSSSALVTLRIAEDLPFPIYLGPEPAG